jgi:hypothetical protein
VLKRLSSDKCDGCGRAFGNCDTTTVGYDNAGVLLHLGACCADRLGEIVAHSVYLAPGSDEVMRLLGAGTPWSEDDRRWFAVHPERSHRVRCAFFGEWPEDGKWHTVIRQTAPGSHQRLPIRLADPPPEGEAPEAAAWALFDTVTEAVKNGDECVPLGPFLARWQQLERGGRA